MLLSFVHPVFYSAPLFEGIRETLLTILVYMAKFSAGLEINFVPLVKIN